MFGSTFIQKERKCFVVSKIELEIFFRLESKKQGHCSYQTLPTLPN